jgi:O-antigen/teichoic acid export membrane protein
MVTVVETEPTPTPSIDTSNRRTSIIKYLKTAVWSKLPASLVLLVITPYATHQFGSQYDAFAALTALLTTIVTFGVGPAAAIEFSKYAENPDQPAENRLLASSIIGTLIVSLAMSVIVFGLMIYPGVGVIFGESLAPQKTLLTQGMILVGIGIFAVAAHYIILNIYWGHLEEYKNSQANIVGQFILVVGCLVAIGVFKSPILFLAIYSLTAPITHLIHGYRLFAIDYPQLRPNFHQIDRDMVKHLIKANFLQSISGLGYVLSRQVPIIAIGTITGSASNIGRSAIFMSWHGPTSNILGLIVASVAGAISASIQSEDYDWTKRTIKKVAKVLLLATALMTALAVLLGPLISQTLFPKHYAMNGLEFALVCLAAASTSILVFSNQVSTAQRGFLQNSIAGIIQGIVGLSLALLLIPSLGAVGFLVGIIGGEISGSIFLVQRVRQFFHNAKPNA